MVFNSYMVIAVETFEKIPKFSRKFFDELQNKLNGDILLQF